MAGYRRLAVWIRRYRGRARRRRERGDHRDRRRRMVMTWNAGYQPPRMPKYTPRRYSVGVDLGQANDFTAIAVLEKTIAPPETALFAPVGESPSNRLVEGSVVFDLVYLKRLKLGTP